MEIFSHKDHFSVYKARCTELGIEMNECAIPKDVLSTGTQVTLDGVVVHQPRPVPFTSEGFRDFLTELIVTQDEALLLVEMPSFHRLMKYLRPSLRLSDISSHNTIHTHILTLSTEVQEKLRARFKRIPAKSLSPKMPGPDHPNDWEIVTDELAFMKLDGRHTGENIGAAIVQTIDRYKLGNQMGWVTSDGAAVNRTATRAI
ncbi:hypothetical protein C8R44DRAFT_896150 [Mycena epipterygia]|nr:hypothetical protein C8R44DRAFT_896150 [Mycena epipterygia]